MTEESRPKKIRSKHDPFPFMAEGETRIVPLVSDPDTTDRKVIGEAVVYADGRIEGEITDPDYVEEFKDHPKDFSILPDTFRS